MSEESKLDLSTMLPGLTEQVAAELRRKAVAAFEYEAVQAVGATARKYIEDVIVPEAQAQLAAAKPELLALFVEAIRQTMAKTAEQILEMTTKRLAGYDGEKLVREVLTAIVGRGY